MLNKEKVKLGIAPIAWTNDETISLNEYLTLTASVFNKKPIIHYMSIEAMLKKYGTAINETGLKFLAEHMCFTIDKAVRDLEYKPSCTPEEAVIETALWAAETTGCKF